MTTWVLYHANCYDGFGAAWAAWSKLGDEGVIYRAVNYGDPPPQELVNRIERLGAEGEPLGDPGPVYVLDFSYRRAVLATLAAARVRVAVPGEIEFESFNGAILDHHKTARAELDGLPFATFDLEKSGAVLAWEHFHPGKSLPTMLAYVQDRDLWAWRLADSRQVAAWMRSWPMEFQRWTRIAEDMEDWGTLLRIRAQGEAIFRFQSCQVEIMADNAVEITLGKDFVGGARSHKVHAANATCFFSEVGEELCKRFPAEPFAAYWLDRKDGKRQWGLRSRGGFDCTTVAKQYGGGGHPGAAGFETQVSWRGE